MSGHKIEGFSGSIPRTGARLLPDNHGQFAQNAKITSGELRAWGKPLTVYTPVKQNVISMFRMNNAGIDYWFTWPTDVNCITGPIAGDTTNKIYYTGDTTGSLAGPKKSNYILGTNTGAAADMPFDFLEMGFPVPPATFTATPGAATSGTAVPRSYVISYISTWGEESAYSLPVTANLQPAQTCGIAALPASLAGKYSIASIRIYKTLTGSTGTTTFLKLTDVNIGTTTFTDPGTDLTLGPTTLPAVTYDAPPANMIGLTSLPNGMMAAFSGNVLCFCEPFLPHAWPLAYRITMDFPIVGIGATGGDLLVATTGAPYVVSGIHPSTMSSTKIQSKESCLSKRGVAEMGYGVMYPSLNGMVLSSSAGSDIVTEHFYTRDEWSILNPSSMMATKYDNKLVVFYKNNAGVYGGFALNPQEKTHAEITTPITGIYNDPQNNSLYVIYNGVVAQFDGDTVNMTPFDWKSKVFSEKRPVNFGAAQIDGDYGSINSGQQAALQAAFATNSAIFNGGAGPTFGELNNSYLNKYTLNGSSMVDLVQAGFLDRYLQVNFYADGVLRYTKNPLNNKTFKLPSGFKCENWQFEISGNVKAYWLKVGETVEDLKQL
jgi:hypothetical protein